MGWQDYRWLVHCSSFCHQAWKLYTVEPTCGEGRSRSDNIEQVWVDSDAYCSSARSTIESLLLLSARSRHQYQRPEEKHTTSLGLLHQIWDGFELYSQYEARSWGLRYVWVYTTSYCRDVSWKARFHQKRKGSFTERSQKRIGRLQEEVGCWSHSKDSRRRSH